MPQPQYGDDDDDLSELVNVLGLETLSKSLKTLAVTDPPASPCNFASSNLDLEYDSSTVLSVIAEQRENFVRTILPQFFMPTLCRLDLLDKNECSVWKEAITLDIDNPKDRPIVYRILNEHIFNTLLDKLRGDYRIIQQILVALRDSGWYPGLADQWEATLRQRIKCNSQHGSSSSLNSTATSNGSKTTASTTPAEKARGNGTRVSLVNFPEPISYCIDRKEKTREIKRKLESMAKKGYGWLVLHGMHGSGKTVLAENTLRCLDSRFFPDGIYWISIGDLKRDRTQEKALYSRMELLHESIDYLYKKNWIKPDTQQKLEFDIRLHFQDNKQSLIVLDDVCQSDTAEHFQFGVPVLVTTCDKSLVPTKVSELHFVSTLGHDGNHILNMEESLTLLKRCMPPGVDLQYFQQNPRIQEIIRSINGLPYCIPHIANYVAPFFENIYKYTEENAQELEEYWDELYKIVANHDSENEDDPDSYESISSFDWIAPLIEKSIATLEPHLIECFYDFAIFAEHVPFSVFRTLWGLKAIQTRNQLEQLLSKSLIKSHAPIDSREVGTKSKFYTVHDITRGFLQKKLGKDNLKARHVKLIESYLRKHCQVSGGGHNYAQLPDDDKYIYRCLSHHLYSAERFDLFPVIFFDLNFIQKKVHLVGQSDMLSDYHYFKSYFAGHEAKLNDFRRFIASNSDLCDPNVDLFQVALCQSNESIVYREASKLVRQFSKFYFDWCNKDYFILENPSKRISFKCPSGARYAALSPDSHFIISVFEYSLQMWNANTVERVANEQAHHDSINYCCFSADGQFVLTTGEDGAGIVWQSPTTRVTTSQTSDPFGTPGIGGGYGRRRRSSGNTTTLQLLRSFTPGRSKIKADSQSDTSGHALKCGDISPDNRMVLLGSSRGCVHLYLLSENQRPLATLTNDENEDFEVRCCHFSPDSRYFLFLVSEVVYVYVVSVDPFNHDRFNAVSVVINRKLKHELVVYNAVFAPPSPRANSNSHLTIFTSSGKHVNKYAIPIKNFDKNIFEWNLERRNFGQTDSTVLRNETSDVQYRYVLPSFGHLALCAVSASGRRIAGFETTRNEIFLWNRGQPHNYFFLRSLSNIITLNFSRDEKYLFALNEKTEITLWELNENTVITSMVDLKDSFAASYDPNNNSIDSLQVLTIDQKGFLRLFSGITGLEVKEFKSALTAQLSQTINILCCDLSVQGHALFGTNTGQVYVYDHSCSNLLSIRLGGDMEDEILLCRFIPSSGGTRFIAMTRAVIFICAIEQHQLVKQNELLLDTITLNESDTFESVQFASAKLLVLWTRASTFAIYDFEAKQFVFVQSNVKSKITSVDACELDKCHLLLVAIADQRLIIFQNLTERHRVVKLGDGEIPRCCQICSSFICYGSDSGQVGLISSEQLSLSSDLDEVGRLKPLWRRQHSQCQWISYLAISPDERFILSAADSIKLWNHEGALLQTFTTHGLATRLYVHFEPYHHAANGQNGHKPEAYHGPELTIVTVTDAKSLYILRNFNRKGHTQQIDML